MYKNISFYETYFLINSVRRTILNLCFRLSNDRVRTIESLAQLEISEIFCFERFIKDGRNIHLLPKKFKEVFLKNRTEKKIVVNRGKQINWLSLNNTNITRSERSGFDFASACDFVKKLVIV